jgi:hypothetical protein
MYKKLSAKVKRLDPKKRSLLTLVAVVAVVLAVLLIIQLTSPKPSVEAYCKVYNEEKFRLAELPGDSWPSAVFDESVGDAGEMAKAFDRLAKVAPDDVKPDVVTLQKLYQKVKDDPSQGFSAALSGIGSEDSLKEWTTGQCLNR